jgi:hypothetical protein
MKFEDYMFGRLGPLTKEQEQKLQVYSLWHKRQLVRAFGPLMLRLQKLMKHRRG